MDLDGLGKVMKSKMRRRLIQKLAQGPLDVNSAVEFLNTQTENEEYRQTVYRGLEDIKEAGLAEKYYDGGSLKYSLEYEKIEIDMENMEAKGK